MELHKFAIITPLGLEDIALQELNYWWPQIISFNEKDKDRSHKGVLAKGIIEIEVPLEYGLLLNHLLKIPTRILLRLREFTAKDFSKLFNKVKKIPWHHYSEAAHIKWEVATRASRLCIKKRIQETCEKASSPLKVHSEFKTSQTAYARIVEDKCTISIDTSGTALYKRSTRPFTEGAPLRENVAAALLWKMLLEDENRNKPKTLWDPMTGSGCFTIEAITLLRPLNHRDFAYTQWDLLSKNKKNIIGSRIKKLKPKDKAFTEYLSSDISEKSILTAQKNFDHLKDLKYKDLSITLSKEDLLNTQLYQKTDLPIWMIINPPYNTRLAVKMNVHELYNNILEQSSNYEHVEKIGLLIPTKYSKKIKTPKNWSLQSKTHLQNGGINVIFLIHIKTVRSS